MTPLLEVCSLCSSFFLDEGELKAVDGMSFTIKEGESVALVGESGCGKTIVALSLLKLLSSPGRVISGQVVLDGEDLCTASAERMRQVRGARIGIIFQEPAAALNPVYTVGSQLTDVIQLHCALDRAGVQRRAIELLAEVGLSEQWLSAFPFELSGGMQQRVLIALAIAGDPALLIADEPTTALDPTVQAEILGLLLLLKQRRRMALLLITHDLGAVEAVSDRILVMYAGKLIESGECEQVLDQPNHPYTEGLLKALPRLGSGRDTILEGIPGAVPDLLDVPTGCAFHPRCPVVEEACQTETPEFRQVGARRHCACHRVKPHVHS